MNKEKFFIAIGPQKTGTTWLHHNLNKHPSVSLPKDKEIRYFSAKAAFKNNNFVTNLFGKDWHYKDKRYKFSLAIKREFNKFIKHKRFSISNLKWHSKYFFGTQNDQWYESLFDDTKLSGDVTPIYCELSDEYLEKIKKLIPNVKIIISLRDPVEREWSRAKMNLMRNHGKDKMEDVSPEDFSKHFKSEISKKLNDYSSLIKKWKKVFDDEHLFVFHYDELQEEPQILFDKICDFLNIPRQLINDISIKINETIDHKIPEIYLNELIDLNYNYIEDYAKNHPNKYSQRWLNRYREKQLSKSY